MGFNKWEGAVGSMNDDGDDFLTNFLKLIAKPEMTEKQRKCDHFLMGKMPDGKFFCPSCGLISQGKQ